MASAKTFKVRNSADLEKMVRQINKEMSVPIQIALQEVADIVKEVWKDFVYAFWYGAYDPILYPRTEETLNAIVTSKVTKIGDLYTVKIHYDTSLIHTFSYGQYKGHPTPDLMPYLIEEGDGKTFGHPRASHAHERVMEWLRDTRDFEDAVISALKAKGINVKLR